MNDETKKYWTDDDEFVEKYVRGEFSYEEKKRLDAEIADCEPCKQKLRNELEMAAGIRRYARTELKSRLQKNLRRERVNQYQYYNWISLAAAVVVIFIGIGVYKLFFNDLTTPTHFQNKEIVLKQNYSPDAEAQEQTKDEKKDEKKKELNSKKRERPSTKIAEEEVTEKKDFGKVEQLAVGVQETEQRSVETAIAGASAETPAENGIWLIGKVIIVSERAAATQKMIASETVKRKKNTEQEITVGAAESSPKKQEMKKLRNDFVLQKKSYAEVPQKFKDETSSNDIAALLEKTENGFVLILFSDNISSDEIQAATIEETSTDSLVVNLPHQKIAYKLPYGLDNSNSKNNRR